MTLPDGFVYGEVRGGLGRWCICRTGGERMLCGRKVHQVPAAGFQPVPEVGEVHTVCLAALTRLTAPPPAPPVRSGVCPVCGERVPLSGGRISGHGGCAGLNMWPKGRRR